MLGYRRDGETKTVRKLAGAPGYSKVAALEVRARCTLPDTARTLHVHATLALPVHAHSFFASHVRVRVLRRRSQDAISIAVHRARIKAIEWGPGGPVESQFMVSRTSDSPESDSDETYATWEDDEGDQVLRFQ